MNSVLRVFAQRWFLMLLGAALVAGVFGSKSEALRNLAEQKWLRDGVVAAVLFMMAFPLESQLGWAPLE
jgi:hypothetical protein